MKQNLKLFTNYSAQFSSETTCYVRPTDVSSLWYQAIRLLISKDFVLLGKTHTIDSFTTVWQMQ